MNDRDFSEYKVSLFYSKYPYNKQSLNGKYVYYEGTIENCPPERLKGIKVNKEHKYVRIWKER